VNRSYCGSALHVRVQSHAAKRPRSDFGYADEPLDRLFVFAHFEEVGARTFQLGDELPARAVFQSLQTEQTPKGEWIQGHAHEALDQTTHLFQINPGARWYYEWESAATKAQRFTKHVLKIYVMQHDSARAALRIVATTASSEFMVVSYRRAPSGITGDRRILALLAENVVRQGGELGLEPDGLIASLGQKMLPFLSATTKEDKMGSASPTSSVSSPTSGEKLRARRRPGSREQYADETRMWAASHQDVLAMSKRLAVLVSFLSAVPAVDFQGALDGWMAAAFSTSSSPQSSPTPHLAGRAWRFLSPLRGAMSGSPDSHGTLPSLRDARLNGTKSEADVLVHQCVQTLSWVFLDEQNRRTLAQFLHESSSVLLDSAALKDLYLRLVTTLHGHIDRFLSSQFDVSFPQLHEDVVATMFRVDAFRPVRTALLSQLSATSMAGFETFVSQARQAFVETRHAAHCRKRTRDGLVLSPPRWVPHGGPSHSPFAGSWSFDGSQCAVVPIGHGPFPLMLSVGGAIEWMREFAAVSIDLNATGSSMAIRSQWSLAQDRGMQLILDGKTRVFDAFPSGVASTVPFNGLAWGDYRAQLVNGNSIMLEFNAWPLAATTSSSHGSPRAETATALRVKLCVRPACADAYTSVLSLDGLVEIGHSAGHAEDLSTLSVTQRQDAVGHWAPLYQVKAVYSPT
jgi:hypothetical protein